MKRIHYCPNSQLFYGTGSRDCRCGYMRCCDNCGRNYTDGAAANNHLPYHPYKCLYGHSVLAQRFYGDPTLEIISQ